MKKYFERLFEYDKWANQTLLNMFDKQFPVNPRIYELFSHLLSAQRIWLDRCEGLPQSVERFQDRLPNEIEEDMLNYNLAWRNFIDQLLVDDFERMVTYTTSAGDTFSDKLTDIIAHVINHGTHHRGNIIVLMKEEGFIPPALDYIFFIRQLV